ncbi:MAG TPA: class I SAM-dependent methyltransferase [Ktedonosporobacter sp.]|nr:class I SAM-dependent methyltransferase [Ktedonosporobacter sp.]
MDNYVVGYGEHNQATLTGGETQSARDDLAPLGDPLGWPSTPGSTRTSSHVLEQVLHHHIVQAHKGLLPPSINPYGLKRVLDVHCQTGAWAIDLARTYPEIHVIGIDTDPALIEIARHNTEISQMKHVLFYEYRAPSALLTRGAASPLKESDPASTREHRQSMGPIKGGDPTRGEGWAAAGVRFPIADQSCDFVHLFLYSPLFQSSEWPFFLGECKRVLKIGGSINLVSLAWGPGSGEAYSRLIMLMEQLLHKRGYSFSEQSGPISPGVFLCHLLREAGFAHVMYTLFPVDFGGWNNSLGRACCQLLLRELRMTRSLLLQYQLIDDKTFEDLLWQQQQEIEASHFCTTAALISTVATKQ